MSIIGIIIMVAVVVFLAIIIRNFTASIEGNSPTNEQFRENTENEVKNNYIEKALNELIPLLGAKEFVDHEKLISLIHSKKIKKAIKEIALYLGLPIEVNISYVPKGYRPSVSDGFQSTHLVKTNWRGKGSSGIVAQVSIPSYLPFYGTPSMVNFPINVRLSENCEENPATLISIMAHELSHIVLCSMWHKKKENEFYTDLTAMLFGFAKVMKTGRRVVKKNTTTDFGIFSNTTTTYTKTTTYGYLSDDNFNFAFHKIESALDRQKSTKNKQLKKLKQFKKQLGKTKKLFFSFEKYLEYLEKNLHKKISSKDGQKISAFYQPGYINNFHFVIRKNETILKNFLKFVESLKTYTARDIEIMQKYDTQLKSVNKELARQDFLLKKDINVLKKYVGFFHKLKLRFFNKQ